MSPAITLCRGHLPYRRPDWRAPHSRAYPRSGHPRSTDHEYSTTRPQTDPVMSDAITPGGHLLVVGHTVCTLTRQPKLKLIGTKPDAEHTANIPCLWFFGRPISDLDHKHIIKAILC